MSFTVCIPTSDGRGLEVIGIYAGYDVAFADAASIRTQSDPSSRASRAVVLKVRTELVPTSLEEEFWLK